MRICNTSFGPKVKRILELNTYLPTLPFVVSAPVHKVLAVFGGQSVVGIASSGSSPPHNLIW